MLCHRQMVGLDRALCPGHRRHLDQGIERLNHLLKNQRVMNRGAIYSIFCRKFNFWVIMAQRHDMHHDTCHDAHHDAEFAL